MAKKARPVTRNIELEMIINGWAWVTEQYAFDREEEYFEAQEDAQRNRRGLWAMDDPEPPWEFKRRRKRLSKADDRQAHLFSARSEEHTSELQSLMRISYAVFCLKKKKPR